MKRRSKRYPTTVTTVMTMPSTLMYVIYDHPTDFPNKFVVRIHTVPGGATAVFGLFDSLDDARAYLPGGLICLKRYPGDEPQIVETWV